MSFHHFTSSVYADRCTRTTEPETFVGLDRRSVDRQPSSSSARDRNSGLAYGLGRPDAGYPV